MNFSFIPQIERNTNDVCQRPKPLLRIVPLANCTGGSDETKLVNANV